MNPSKSYNVMHLGTKYLCSEVKDVLLQNSDRSLSRSPKVGQVVVNLCFHYYGYYGLILKEI